MSALAFLLAMEALYWSSRWSAYDRVNAYDQRQRFLAAACLYYEARSRLPEGVPDFAVFMIGGAA